MLVLSANHEPGRRIAISTAKDKPTCYDRKDWPQGIVSDTLDGMVKAGLLIRHSYNYKQLLTTVEPAPRLLEVLGRHGVRLADLGRKAGVLGEAAYRIPGLEEHRDAVKLGIISLLSRRGPMKQLSEELRELLPDDWKARRFSDAAAEHHSGIADMFGTDVGIELMFTESQLLVHLLLRLNDLGIPA